MSNLHRMNCDYRVRKTLRALLDMGHSLGPYSNASLTTVDNSVKIRFASDLVMIQGENTTAAVAWEEVTIDGSLTTPEGRLIQRIIDAVLAASPERSKAQKISERRVTEYKEATK